MLFLEKIIEYPSCSTSELFYSDFYSQKEKGSDFKEYSKEYIQWVCDRIKDNVEKRTFPLFVSPKDYELFNDIFNVESDIAIIY